MTQKRQRRAKDLPPEDIVNLFVAAERETERRGTYWLTQCPVHDDHRPSLKVDAGDKVPTVVTCYAGCNSSDIWHWIEEEFAGAEHGESDFQPRIERKTSGGRLRLDDYAAYLHVPTKFLQSMGIEEAEKGIAFPFGSFAQKLRVVSADGKRSFRWHGGEANQFPLFPVPSEPLPVEIWICEGETDGIIARYLGLDAFALTSGSSAAPKHLTVEHFTALKRWGVKTIVFVPHNDEPGQKCTGLLTTSAQAAGLDVRWCILKEDRENPFDVTLQPTDLHEWVLAQDTHTPVQMLRQRLEQQRQFKHIEDGRDFIKHADEQINWVIPELIAAGDVIGIVAPPKNLKTYFALSLMHSLASGEPFMRRGSMTPSRPQKVMFVEEEGHRIHFARRMRRITDAHDQDWKVSPTIRWSSGFLLEEAAVDALIAEINFHDVDVLILDPWQRISKGAEEASATETGPLWDEIFRIRQETNCTILIVHHMRKDAELSPDAIRGSSRFRGEVDASILLQYDSDALILKVVVEGRDIPHSASDGAHPVKVIWYEDFKDVFALDGCEFEETVSISMKKGPVSDQNKEKIFSVLAAHGDWMSKKEVIAAADMSDNTVGKHLKTLTDDGRLDQDDPGPGKATKWKAN